MTSTLMVIQIALAIIIAIAVLLQKSSSIGLGAYTSSNESMFGAKGPAGFLAKFTSIAALLFVINTLALGYYYSKENGASSIKVDAEENTALSIAGETNTSASTENNTSTATVTTDNNKTQIVVENQDGTTITATASSASGQDSHTAEQNVTTKNQDQTGKNSATEANTTEANATEANITEVNQTTAAPSKDAPIDANPSKSDETNNSATAQKSEQAVSSLSKEAEQAAIIADINANKTSSRPHVLKGVFFRTGSATLSKKSMEQINDIITALRSNPSVKILLRGHTDNIGNSKKNLALSQRRADSLKNQLRLGGIESGRISTEGKGDTDPIVPNDTKENRLLNRRVDIAVVN